MDIESNERISCWQGNKKADSKIIFNEKTGEAMGIVKAKPKNIVEKVDEMMKKLKEMGAIDG